MPLSFYFTVIYSPKPVLQHGDDLPHFGLLDMRQSWTVHAATILVDSEIRLALRLRRGKSARELDRRQ
jgi:hypothetical protein